jgi:hypothetical protein
MSGLPDASEPLKLADGSLVYPGGRRSVQSNARQYVEIPNNQEAQRLIVNTRRKLADLPDIPKTMNAIGVVLSYSLFGLDDTEIALATGLTDKQVGQIKMHDAYQSMLDSVTRSVLDAEATTVRDMFQQHSRTAAGVMVEALHNGARADRMAAARDLLDRAGHRPSDVVEHRHRMDGGLVIEIVKRDDSGSVPSITIDGDV